MSSLRKETYINCKPEVLWAAIKNLGNIYQLFPGVLTASHMINNETRVVTFANGMEVQERIITVDNAAKRFVYAAVKGGVTTHHNASWQVFDDGHGGSHFVWISDFLPDSATQPVEELTDSGCQALKRTMESQAVRH